MFESRRMCMRRREAIDIADVMLGMFRGAREVIPVLQPLTFLPIGIH